MYTRTREFHVRKSSALADKLSTLFLRDESTFYNADIDDICKFSVTDDELLQDDENKENK